MVRCKWCNLKNPLYIRYHDEEWGVLRTDDPYLYEMLILESFQAGLSWECVLNKREAFRKAFDGFDIEKISCYDEGKILSLCENKDIIRNKLKIKAAVNNSRIFKDIVAEYGSFYNYLCTFTEGKLFYETELTRSPLSDSISADLVKRGMKFCGSVIIYSYLQAVGIISSHEKECFMHGYIEKSKVTEFFDSKAAQWDSMAIDCPDKIDRILHLSDLKEEQRILDIACGTGILVPFYQKFDPEKILCVDISEKMLIIAEEKFGDMKNIEFLRADAEDTDFPCKYDFAMIFDAFPHFGNPVNLISNISKALVPKGRITVAHSMGIKQLDKHHEKAAPNVSNKMLSADELAELLSVHFNIDTIISEDDIYVVSGRLK